ncbi:hypothetical protein DERF_014959 [Dermatophagoides farinae]|uniref:Uncharacterized protein n=1 Tax=Dermatophagoides farinae TaxID=6954 RepID=A0A922KZS4_DERFA|nr:hypothetical protein DERF_014959 [Dermatophagoides farinae]
MGHRKNHPNEKKTDENGSKIFFFFGSEKKDLSILNDLTISNVCFICFFSIITILSSLFQ